MKKSFDFRKVISIKVSESRLRSREPKVFLVKVRTPFFQHQLLAADARECLKSLWALAGQDFEVTVLDEQQREVSMMQLEAEATATTPPKTETKGGEIGWQALGSLCGGGC